MKIYTSKISKGMAHDPEGSEEIAIINFKTFFGWTHSLEITRDLYNYIGEVMGWDQ